MLQSLVSISPSDVITFELVQDTAPKTILRVTNTSNDNIAFKVKTTQPSWYYVRPNQQVLSPGQSEDVAVVLVEAECNRFIEQGDISGKTISNHRFLVQSKPIDTASFEAVSVASQSQKPVEFSKFWEAAPKEERKNHKLKVDFVFPNSHNPLPTVHEGAELESPISANVDNIRKKLSSEEPMVSNSLNNSVAGTPEALLAELQSLRKKYDAIVEYTVHLTAERDYHFSQSEEKRSAEEKLRERSKKKSSDSVPKSKSGEKLMEKKASATGGVPSMVVIVVAFLAFLLGRWLKF